MRDYGEEFRKLFLDAPREEERQRKQLNWILAIAFIFFGAHIAYYLLKTI